MHGEDVLQTTNKQLVTKVIVVRNTANLESYSSTPAILLQISLKETIMFTHEGHYVCVCGREFTKSQSFNAHKSHCKLHLGEAKYNARMARSKQNLRYASEVVSQHKAALREAKLAQ